MKESTESILEFIKTLWSFVTDPSLVFLIILFALLMSIVFI